MYSYPNYIPLPASAIERIMTAVEPFEFDRVYGAFWDMVIERDGKAAVKRSAERYYQGHPRIVAVGHQSRWGHPALLGGPGSRIRCHSPIFVFFLVTKFHASTIVLQMSHKTSGMMKKRGKKIAISQCHQRAVLAPRSSGTVQAGRYTIRP